MSAANESRTAGEPSRLFARIALGLGLALALYAGFVLWADAGRIATALEGFDARLVPLACALSLANYGLRFARWQRYLAVLRIRVAPSSSFLIHLAGLSLTVSPGKMGEALKSWLLKRVTGTPVSASAPIVVAERFTDLLAFLVLIAIGGLATAPELAWIFWATLALCAVLLLAATSLAVQHAALVLLARLPAGARIAPKLEASLASTRALLAPRELPFATLVATAGWALECTAFWSIASAFVPGGVPWLFATYVFAVAAVAGAVLIVFPGGLGVTEASMGALLRARYVAAGLGVEAASAAAVSATLVIRLCTLWFAVLVGVLALVLFNRRHR